MNTPNQNSKGILNQGTGKAKGIRKKAERKEIMGGCGSPCATLFITVLFLQQLTENLQYQLVIKDRAAADEAVAASMSISDSNWHLERLTEAHTCS